MLWWEPCNGEKIRHLYFSLEWRTDRISIKWRRKLVLRYRVSTLLNPTRLSLLPLFLLMDAYYLHDAKELDFSTFPLTHPAKDIGQQKAEKGQLWGVRHVNRTPQIKWSINIFSVQSTHTKQTNLIYFFLQWNTCISQHVYIPCTLGFLGLTSPSSSGTGGRKVEQRRSKALCTKV